MKQNRPVLVLLSGGQDSTTCLYWAKHYFETVVAIGFAYGQKHIAEIAQAQKIASDARVEYNLLNCTGLLEGSSLVEHWRDHNSSHEQNPALPASFTPGRNMLFLTLAASFAFNYGIRDIVTGVCQTDYSGYPDCRRDFIDQMEHTLSYAVDPAYTMSILEAAADDKKHMNPTFSIHTPLMKLTKAETWKLANELGCLKVVIDDSMTDYNGDQTKNEWGMGVNNNPATELRVKGFYEAKQKGWLRPMIEPVEGF